MSEANTADRRPMVEQVWSGIDWLSASYSSDAIDYELVLDRWQESLIHQIDSDYKAIPAYLNGYQGARTRYLFFGTRDDGCFIQVTSGMADELFPAIWRDGCNISRLDVQVTLKYDRGIQDEAQKIYSNINRRNRTASAANRVSARYITSTQGGGTVYVGSAKSRQYGRIYDKYAESGEECYRNAWRYETVLKNNIATSVAQKIPMSRDRRCDHTVNVVCEWFARRAIRIRALSNVEWVSIDTPVIPPSDAASKLKWLETQVAPSIRWLTERGYRDSVLAALGLSSD